MKVAIDANIFIDVFEKRDQFYWPSAHVLSKVLTQEISAIVPAHVITNTYYMLRKILGKEDAESAVDWMLRSFETLPLSDKLMISARSLLIPDFDDGIVAASAQAAACNFIVTRDIAGFKGSVVPAISPAELLSRLA